MKKFTAWLSANPGMAAHLARTLKINPTNISNAKKGHLLMPTAWMKTIIKLSNNELTHKVLVEEREIHRLKKMKARALKAKSIAKPAK
jgi:hypothetical protein